jgi:glucosamine-6-phosphate deaminase
LNFVRAGDLQVQVFSSKREASREAAEVAAGIVRRAISDRGHARMVVSTGNSQFDFIEALVAVPDLDWSAVEAFHLDEYAGMPMTHPASFRLWLKTRLADRVPLRAMYYLNGDAPDPEAESRRYGALLAEAPIDVGFIGIGENGHIAFNDPAVADFADPEAVKTVQLDDACRRQQVGEGHFAGIAEVPERALSLTCPTIMGMANLICCVPELRKARAVRDTIEGPISTSCPASILRTHRSAWLLLDAESASLLSLTGHGQRTLA